MKYRRKPTFTEAAQWLGDVSAMTGTFSGAVQFADPSGEPYVITIHGQRAYLAHGDWIIPEANGVNFYPCKPQIFEATYELVEEES